jgi:hypothetical protein
MRFLKPGFVATLLIAMTACMYAEEGIAWNVQGTWRQNHAQTLLEKGNSVVPGALLTAETSGNAAILVLLPDGQRLLFDCQDNPTCTQGFRVPALIAKPDDDVLAMFSTVQRALKQPACCMAPPPATTTAEAEVVVPIQADGTITLKQALAALPPGQYSMTVQSEADTQPSKRSLTWSGPGDEAQLILQHKGMYCLQDLRRIRARAFTCRAAGCITGALLISSSGFRIRQKNVAGMESNFFRLAHA